MELNSVKGLTANIIVSFSKKVIRRAEKSMADLKNDDIDATLAV